MTKKIIGNLGFKYVSDQKSDLELAEYRVMPEAAE